MGLGMPAQLAEVLGNQANALACTGTTQGTAATIKTTNTELVSSASNTGAVLQATVPIGSPHYVFNSQATTAVVYVPTGDALNGSTNGTLSVAQNKGAILWKYKTAGSVGSWASIVAA
jgi:hypothetical protein